MKAWKSRDGRITLLHGNSRDLFCSNDAAAIVTDPPYGISFADQPTKWQRRAGNEARDWDSRPVDLSFMRAGAEFNDYPVAIWGGNYFDLPRSRGWLAWVKPDSPPSMGSVELCWTNQDRNARHVVCTISSTNAERVGHPTQKPLAVMLATLDYLGLKESGRAVIDPFMGSGTTIVACINRGLMAVGIEVEKDYFHMAVDRVERAYQDDALLRLTERRLSVPERSLFSQAK